MSYYDSDSRIISYSMVKVFIYIGVAIILLCCGLCGWCLKKCSGEQAASTPHAGTGSAVSAPVPLSAAELNPHPGVGYPRVAAVPVPTDMPGSQAMPMPCTHPMPGTYAMPMPAYPSVPATLLPAAVAAPGAPHNLTYCDKPPSYEHAVTSTK